MDEVEFHQVGSEEQKEEAGSLICEYLEWLNHRLKREYGIEFDVEAMVQSDLSDPDKFHPPQGRFYLADWKSNHLGNTPRDYAPERMAAEMMEQFYILQYHLYVVALTQYLKLRVPDYAYERHFGGIFYIFLRGVDSETGPEFGVYRDVPKKELVDELCKTLIGQPSTPSHQGKEGT